MNWTEFFDATWQFALVTGLSFVVLCIAASMVCFQQLSNPTGLSSTTDGANSTIRFQAQVAARLGTVYHLAHPFCLLIAGGPATEAAVREQTLASLRRTVRQTDVVMALDDGTIGLLVDTARRNAEKIFERMLAALSPPLELRLGAGSYPENGIRVQPLMEAARAALPGTGAGWTLAAPTATGEKTPMLEDNGTAAEQDGLVDPLTGVLRSDRLRRVMPKFVARYRRESLPISLIYLDVDYLERYNDHYGRAAGDEILRGVGLLLQHQVREDDLIGRVAADDFVVLLNCTPNAALTVANRLSAAIKRTTFTSAGYSLKVTISGGVAGCPEHGRTATQIFDAAHAALLAAQDRGRNMSLLFDQTMSPYHTTSLGADVF